MALTLRGLFRVGAGTFRQFRRLSEVSVLVHVPPDSR